MTTLIFPSNVLNHKKVDPHYLEEYLAAQAYDIPTQLVDHDALVAGELDKVKLTSADIAVYRGWMLTPTQYSNFEYAAKQQRCYLKTTAGQYELAHYMPRWVARVSDFTAETKWTKGNSIDDLVKTCARFSSGTGLVLRDFEKSEKHYWNEACYIPDSLDESSIRSVAKRFLELRGDSFKEGFVVRRFENYLTGEMRTWWIDGRCMMTTSHPDTPDLGNESFVLPDMFEHFIGRLNLPFVTTDFAQRDDGIWRLIEIGDGQVSDWPATLDAKNLLRYFAHYPL